MYHLRRDKRGMEAIDFAVTVGAITTALVVIGPLAGRALKGQVFGAVHALGQVTGTGDLSKFTPKEQYEPYYAETKAMQTQRSDDYTEKYAKGTGVVTRTGHVTKATRLKGGKEFTRDASHLVDDDKWTK